MCFVTFGSIEIFKVTSSSQYTYIHVCIYIHYSSINRYIWKMQQSICDTRSNEFGWHWVKSQARVCNILLKLGLRAWLIQVVLARAQCARASNYSASVRRQLFDELVITCAYCSLMVQWKKNVLQLLYSHVHIANVYHFVTTRMWNFNIILN